jgi:hypothetical protein
MRAPWLQALEDVVTLLAQRGDVDAAATAAGLATATDQMRAAAGLARAPRAEATWTSLQARLRQALGPAAMALALQQACGWDSAQAQARALAQLAPAADPARAGALAHPAAA